MNTIGIDNSLDRARIRILLAIGLLGCALTGAGDFLLGYAEHAELMGNAVTFGGLLVMLPSEERFPGVPRQARHASVSIESQG